MFLFALAFSVFFSHMPITNRVELVLSLCISCPVTPGLILMLNYFSFANDVARLQSASGICMEAAQREQVLWRCSSIAITFVSVLHYWWSSNQSIQYSQQCFWICCWLWVASICPYVFCSFVCVSVYITSHLVTPHLVITSTNAEYAWLYS